MNAYKSDLKVINGHTHLKHNPWNRGVVIRVTEYLLFTRTYQHIHNHTLILEGPVLHKAKVDIKLYVKSGDIIK